MADRSPDYNLKILNKVTNEKGRIGAAWVNEDDSISIVLNTMVVLPQNKDIEISLFPNDRKQE